MYKNPNLAAGLNASLSDCRYNHVFCPGRAKIQYDHYRRDDKWAFGTNLPRRGQERDQQFRQPKNFTWSGGASLGKNDGQTASSTDVLLAGTDDKVAMFGS